MKNAKSDNESTSESKQESVPTFVSPIAKPLAGKSLEKKVFKLVKKGRLTRWRGIFPIIVCVAAKAKCTRRGVKEVVKSIRKNEKGWEVIQKDDWIEWWFLLRTLLLWMSFLTFLCYVRRRVFYISLLVRRYVVRLNTWLVGSIRRCCDYEASYQLYPCSSERRLPWEEQVWWSVWRGDETGPQFVRIHSISFLSFVCKKQENENLI